MCFPKINKSGKEHLQLFYIVYKIEGLTFTQLQACDILNIHLQVLL